MAVVCYFGFGIELDASKDYDNILKDNEQYLYKVYNDEVFPLVRYLSYDPYYGDYDKPWKCLIYAFEKANNYVMSSGLHHLSKFDYELTPQIINELDKAHRILTGLPIDRYRIKLMVAYTTD